MAIGINWGEIWNEAVWDDVWAQIASGNPELVPGMLAADGSLNVALNTGSGDEYTGGKGVYSKSGGMRVNTTSTAFGLYADDGAYRGTVSDDEGSPAPGVGHYTPSGGLRLTSSGSAYYNQPGIYAKDGRLRVTNVNP
jgi:hypothetical protein